jgi:hypothetical protein
LTQLSIGEYDCMDYSDEHRPFDHSTCGYQSDTFNCDEHICSVGEWSCGDGQCIDEINRYEWQENDDTTKAQCHSMREYMFMCELSSHRHKLWTSVDGTCHSSIDFDLVDEGRDEYNQTADEYCQYLVKCALSDVVERKCACGQSDCGKHIAQHCTSSIAYPSKGLLTPYLIAYYDVDRLWSGTKQPDFYTISGSIRCRGYQAQTHVNKSIQIRHYTNRRHLVLDNTFCEHADILKDTNGLQFHKVCYANVSNTLGTGLLYAFLDVCTQCISQYRINDGTQDCISGEDERYKKRSMCTDRIRHHRYRCSSEQSTCLMVKTIGDSHTHCTRGDDEFAYGSGQSISNTRCEQIEDEGCRFLREYILESTNNFSNSTQMILNAKIPFRSYCNTFWDLKDKSDETLETCRSWKCSQSEVQCGTGQCIPGHYICDGEWDCSDASDELLDINRLSYYNPFMNLTKEQATCAAMRNKTVQAFGNLCNLSTEYPCLLINFTRQTDIFHTRPCIKISQIGDNVIDCLGGLDEMNTLTHCDEMHQLGFAFQCRSTPNWCVDNQHLCKSTDRCPNHADDSVLCGDRYNNCSASIDFRCMNDSCTMNARCNRQIECANGEDEYWCKPNITQSSSKQYRISKKQRQIIVKKYVTLPMYPPILTDIKIVTEKAHKTLAEKNTPNNVPSSIATLMCNRGVGVLNHKNTTICFCPPSYYGEYCEFHSDRITSYVHLDVSHSHYAQLSIDRNITIKVLVLLMHKGQIINTREFHFRSAVDFHRIVKKKYHLLYSKEIELFEEKIRRRSNRTSIVTNTLYHLRYEAYELRADSSIHFVGVWQYSLFFDFLPSFRLAKILRFHDLQADLPDSPCHSNPCKSTNAECHILQNDHQKYVCLCKPGYSGEYCSTHDQSCANNFCHSKSLCKPDYMGKMAGNRLPFCLCPLNVYGTKCGLVYDPCWMNPCKNNGTCYPSTSDLTKVNCVCNKDYYGLNCESQIEADDLSVDATNVTGTSVIQYLYIDFKSLNLIPAHQNISKESPVHLHYQHVTIFAPDIVLLKSYSAETAEYPKIFLLSLAIKEKKINSSTFLGDENLCLNVKDRFLNIPGEFSMSVKLRSDS